MWHFRQGRRKISLTVSGTITQKIAELNLLTPYTEEGIGRL
jgi:hypothetical protein